MVQKKLPRRTRERILETSLALFNRAGEPHVTTADVANEMSISPGNLYYHFRNKDDIIGELYGALEAKIMPLLNVPEHRAPDVEDLWLLLHLLFECMREYRFFYRDLDEITSRNRRIAARFGDLTRQFETTVVKLCRGLVAANAMRATEREIAALASNIVLVSTYWMSYQRIGRPTTNMAAGAEAARLDHAALQVMALIAPFLLGSGRLLIERLGEGYR
ncbi:MAG: TetR/AcrR family transcriptional regulator [Betaproteobacteria bacterium]|nr:TetR/AcrR family transcriptional regulator [Betaproteobacteria bacterium]MBA3775785.1 TetR/AcrR family transcriptional regulator [Betaproteobacteria bacterium]